MKKINSKKYENILRQRLAEHGNTCLARFDKLTPSHRSDFIQWITGADRESTRMGRIDKVVGKLISRYPLGQA